MVVFSTVYRTWSGIQARSLLDQLEPFMTGEAYGFLRGREATQAWMGLQGILEVAALQKEQLCGVSTDLRKAFECIPRDQSFMLSKHLGVPARVCDPWRNFLNQCQRAFLVRGCLSEATTSLVGMPEGDALSVLAMTQLDFAWHRYLQVYCPTITASSYVDNLGLRGSDPTEVLRGLLLTSTFFDMWHMHLDQGKTFTWSNASKARSVLRLAPYECVTSLAELGGCMVYDGKLRNAQQIRRLHSLEAKWERLRFSQAPLCLKLAALPIHFWAKALHGAPSCRFGSQHLTVLRTKALRTLRLAKAGVNSMLRLTLSTTPAADPGLYQLQVTVLTFQRMCLKMQPFVENWGTWIAWFTGTLGQGPYAKLYEQLALVNWQIQVPYLYDHDGVRHSILLTNPDDLRELLFDAWLQHVSSKVTHRKTMSDLVGLDGHLVRSMLKGKDALQLSLLGMLNAGAFLDQAAHAKFDLTKDGLCVHCQVADDQPHWLVCPARGPLRRKVGLDDVGPEIPTALKLHLLPSRNPELAWFKHYFEGLDSQFEFWLTPQGDIEHLFTDGSCCGSNTSVPYASWSVVSATQGAPVCVGHLAGIWQTVARAEICAVLAALGWASGTCTQLHLWVDSKFVVDTLRSLLRTGIVGRHWAHQDLWHRIADLLEVMVHPPRCTWIPSHWKIEDSDNAFEDWLHHWNDQADMWAVDCNGQRPEGFWEHRQVALDYHQSTLRQMQQLAAFYFACAEAAKDAPRTSTTEQASEDRINSFSWATDSVCLSDVLPVDFRSSIAQQFRGELPVTLVQQFVERILAEENQATGIYPCTYVELIFLWKLWGGDFPTFVPGTGEWVCRPLEQMPIKPTLGAMIRVFRGLFWGLRDLMIGDVFGRGWNKVELGIHVSTSGVFLGLTSELVRRLRTSVSTFTASWPIRTARDLARPF